VKAAKDIAETEGQFVGLTKSDVLVMGSDFYTSFSKIAEAEKHLESATKGASATPEQSVSSTKVATAPPTVGTTIVVGCNLPSCCLVGMFSPGSPTKQVVLKLSREGQRSRLSFQRQKTIQVPGAHTIGASSREAHKYPDGGLI
jgi:hypothetical protein